jgi:hypothetical protein
MGVSPQSHKTDEHPGLSVAEQAGRIV